MDPLTIAAIAGVAAPVIGGIAGGQAAKGDRRKAQQEIEKMREIYGNLETPDIADLQYTPATERYVGNVAAPDIFMPGEITSEMAGITTDPRFQEAQIQAMGSMDEVIEGGGMTDMDRLNAMKAMQQAEGQASAQQADIQQDMARRGMGGSGQELLAKLTGSQGAVNRAADATQQMQASAQQRALDAIMQKGGMAGQMRGQEFGEKSTRAQAADTAARFNIQNAIGQRNLQSQLGLDVDMANRATQQGVEGRNVAGTNQAGQFNAGAHGQKFGMDAQKAAGQAGAAQAASGMYSGQADRKANQWAQGGAAVGKGATGYATQQHQQELADKELVGKLYGQG